MKSYLNSKQCRTKYWRYLKICTNLWPEAVVAHVYKIVAGVEVNFRDSWSVITRSIVIQIQNHSYDDIYQITVGRTPFPAQFLQSIILRGKALLSRRQN